MVATEVDAAESEQDALIQYLRDRNAACPLCKYNLRGLTSHRCPECGRELQLTVGLAEPRIGAWVMCLIALAASGGLGVLAVVTLIRHGWPANYSAQHAMIYNGAFAYFLASVPAVPAVLLFRRRFRRMPERVQWAAACTAAVLTALAFAALAIQ